MIGVDRIPVTILTGFLGSGKTTLLAALIQRLGFSGTAVVMNEFGEMALDHHLIEMGDEDLLTLSTGCLCCASHGDLSRAILGLLAGRDAGDLAFERIVIETTGMANPGPIIQALMTDPSLNERTRLVRIVTVADALTGLTTLQSRREARRQAAVADQIIITKADLADVSDVTALDEELRRRNPTADISVASNGDADPALLLAPAKGHAAAVSEGDSHDHDHGDVRSITVCRDAPIQAAALPLFLEALAETFGPNLLRVKGLAVVAEAPDRPAVIHGVQHVFFPIEWLDSWPVADRRTRLTLIGEGLTSGWPELLLDALDEEAAFVASFEDAGDPANEQSAGA